MPLIYVLAGEASGDVLGARLIAALRRQRPSLEFAGVGGPRMHTEGVAPLFPMAELAVMGLAEVLPRVLKLRARLDDAVQDITRRRPDVVVTVDSPGFMLRLLRRIAPLGLKRVQYVAPQAWAWRERRVRRFPGLWDRLLCLLPFETAFYARHGIEARFVGHPVLESGADQGDAARFRAAHGLAEDAPILLLMPGSRRNEAPRLLPVLGATVDRLLEEVPGLVPVVPTSHVVAERVAAAAAGWRTPPILVTDLDGKHDAYAAAAPTGAALTKSGTSTLELAMAGVPMAVTYRVNPLTAVLARRLIRVPHVSMVNLLAGRELVPELLQEHCTPARLAEAAKLLMTGDATGMAGTQKAGFEEILTGLRPPEGTASAAAAREVLELLDQS